MSLVYFAGGLLLGFFFGIGAALFYLRWKMKRQLGNLEDQMGAMMDMSEEMSDMMEPDFEEVEEKEEEEK